jgi:hypothetical protein
LGGGGVKGGGDDAGGRALHCKCVSVPELGLLLNLIAPPHPQFAGVFLLRAIGQHEWWSYYYPNIEGVGNELFPQAAVGPHLNLVNGGSQKELRSAGVDGVSAP